MAYENGESINRHYVKQYGKEKQKLRHMRVQGFEGTNSHYYAGIQSKLAKKPETTYHLGYGYRWNLNSGSNSSSNENSSSFDLRVGTYSHDFYGADNINFTLGAGYYYRNFHFDFSLNSTGMKLADSDYLFSISAGI